MKLTKEILYLIEAGKISIKNSKRGELNLSIRKQIWKSFGAINDDILIEHNVPLKRRVKLAMLAVNKVVNLWQEVDAEDKRPTELLKLVDKYMKGELVSKELSIMISEFSTDLIDLSSDEEYYNVVAIGFAAVSAASISLHDEELIRYDKENLKDDDLDPFTYDASYFACMPYSNGGYWEEASDVEKRREFWLWYLTEAVAKAYDI